MGAMELDDHRLREKMTWRTAVLRALDSLGRENFTLQEMYAFADWFSELFPSNLHIEDKIRQQLQYLRDEGYLEFVDNHGTYRIRAKVNLRDS